MIVSDLYVQIQDNLSGRQVPTAKMAEAIRKCVLEFTENYKFPGLQAPGPTVQFTVNVSNYNTSYFTQPADGAINLNKIDSFFVYNDPMTPPVIGQTTGGYNLGYKTVNTLEVLFNVPGIPTLWTRYNGQIWVASIPDNEYYTYMRYQHEHPFPNAGTSNAGLDPILLPNSWQDVLEYAATQRLAPIYNLASKAQEMNEILNGSKKWQESGGLEGQPGLIFQRTSQEQRDQSTGVKRLRLRMGRG